MNPKTHTEALDHLFEAVLKLESLEECYKFFSDVCTIKELMAMSQRYEVALMLNQKMTYLDIEKTGCFNCDHKQSQQIPDLWRGRIPPCL